MQNSLTLPEKNREIELQTKTQAILKQVKNLEIKQDSDYQEADQILKKVKSFIKKLNEERKGYTTPLDELKKRIMSVFKTPIENLKQAESSLKNMMIAFDKMKEKIEQEQLAKEIEKQNEQIKILEEQLKNTNDEVVSFILEQQIKDLSCSPVIQSNTHRKNTRLSTRATWKGDVVDKVALLKWILKHSEYIDIIDIKQGALNKMLTSTKGNLVPDGVTVKKETIAIAR